MTDNLDLSMHMAMTGANEAAADIARVREAIAAITEPARRAQAQIKRMGQAFESVTTSARAATDAATAAVTRMNTTIAAETKQLRAELTGTFRPLGTSAKENTTAATTAMNGMSAETTSAIERIRTAAASAFEPISASMTSAAETVKAGFVSINAAMAETIAQAKAAAAELKASSAVPGSPNAGLRRAAERGGRHGPHFRAEGVKVPGGYVGLGGGPLMAGAAVGGYAVWEAMRAQDEAIRTALTSPADAAMMGLTADDYQRRIMAGAASTGADIGDVAEAYRTATRATQGVPAEERLKLIDALLPKAMAESKLKPGSSLPEALESLIGLSHMLGNYKIDDVKSMANKFSVASLGVNASLPELSKTLGYSLPVLHAGLGIDEDTVMALTSALYGAGINLRGRAPGSVRSTRAHYGTAPTSTTTRSMPSASATARHGKSPVRMANKTGTPRRIGSPPSSATAWPACRRKIRPRT